LWTGFSRPGFSITSATIASFLLGTYCITFTIETKGQAERRLRSMRPGWVQVSGERRER
jgi:hypothetical protein